MTQRIALVLGLSLISGLASAQSAQEIRTQFFGEIDAVKEQADALNAKMLAPEAYAEGLELYVEAGDTLAPAREAMLLESRSTNTGENVQLSRLLLAERGTLPRSAIAVHKPYMERRTLATFGVRWPELDLVVTSPQLDFEAYTRQGIPREDVIQIMVGDLQRLLVYAKKGFSTPQPVPAEVMAAYEGLVAAGYTKRLLPGA